MPCEWVADTAPVAVLLPTKATTTAISRFKYLKALFDIQLFNLLQGQM